MRPVSTKIGAVMSAATRTHRCPTRRAGRPRSWPRRRELKVICVTGGCREAGRSLGQARYRCAGCLALGSGCRQRGRTRQDDQQRKKPDTSLPIHGGVSLLHVLTVPWAVFSDPAEGESCEQSHLPALSRLARSKFRSRTNSRGYPAPIGTGDRAPDDLSLPVTISWHFREWSCRLESPLTGARVKAS